MVPSTSETKPINATNKCIMNVKSERRSDSGNFGVGITEFRVVVGKIRWLEVSMATVWIFLGLRTSLELFFKNQGSDCETSRPQVDYPKVHGPFYKISEFNQNNELFMYRKSRGLGPWVVDHSRVARSTVDLWRRGQEGGVLGLIGARATVWGRAMVMMWRWRRSSAATALKLRERGKRAGVGAVRTDGGVSLL
jgi:hypothetical protein